MKKRGTYLACAAAGLAALFMTALPVRAQVDMFNKPAWEKELRRIMWRHKSCVALGEFIWEVGDANKIITRDFSLRGAPPTPDGLTPMHDVSAFVFATYLLERNKGELDDAQLSALTMRSGYNAPLSQSCNIATSVESCYSHMAETKGEPGAFFYGPGHLQKLAMDLGLGTFRDGDMRDEYASYMGNTTRFQFETMRILDGLRMTPDNLSKFLRSVVAGELYMYEHLGRDAVCLDPSSCKDTKVIFAPSPRTRDYSIGHWVEKDFDGKITGYSANGKSGIYVWISANKKYYGYIVPRDTGLNKSMEGIGCGRAMMGLVNNVTAPRPAK